MYLIFSLQIDIAFSLLIASGLTVCDVLMGLPLAKRIFKLMLAKRFVALLCSLETLR